MISPKAIKMTINAKISTNKKDCSEFLSALRKLNNSKIPSHNISKPKNHPDNIQPIEDLSVTMDGIFFTLNLRWVLK